jgi:putative transposase
MKKGEQESLHPGDSEKIVKILAYCLMPTHIHLALQQMTDGGISNFIYRLLKGYSQYFNLKHARKGPLWEGRFVNILVKTDGQLLHLTRYIHLNPVTALLVDKPEEWKFSSYREYVSLLKEGERKICDFSHQLTINAEGYKKFVLDRIDYQRKLALIKHLSGE